MMSTVWAILFGLFMLTPIVIGMYGWMIKKW